MTDSGRRRNPFRPRTVSGTPPGQVPGPPLEQAPPAPEPGPVGPDSQADTAQQEPSGWFREESVEGAAAEGAAAPFEEAGEPPETVRAAAAAGTTAAAGATAAADAEGVAWSEEAELVELAPGSEPPAAAATVPVSFAAAPAAGTATEPRRGSAAARLRTLILAVLAVALTAVLGFAAGTILPTLLPGPGIAGAPTEEPPGEPTLEPTAEPTEEPAATATLEPTAALTATPEATPSPTPKVTIHVVKAGENLTVIAAKYGVTIKAIQALNGITNPNKIFPGQKLKIPPRS